MDKFGGKHFLMTDPKYGPFDIQNVKLQFNKTAQTQPVLKQAPKEAVLIYYKGYHLLSRVTTSVIFNNRWVCLY